MVAPNSIYLSYSFAKVFYQAADTVKVFSNLDSNMKYSKIISITLTNAFILLIFASLLSSCQKNKIKTTGLYTDYTSPQRSPASIKSNIDFDPKQIYIFCSIHSVNTKQCYKQYYNEQIQLMKSSQKNMDVSMLMSSNNYEKIEQDVKYITTKILEKLETKIEFYSSKREDFCRKNSKYYLKKCLNGNIDSDTMNILNSYQQAVNKINGHEYLYLKHKIKNKLMQRLDSIYDEIDQSI